MKQFGTKQDDFRKNYNIEFDKIEPKDHIGKNEEFINILTELDKKLDIGFEPYESVLRRSLFMIEEIKK